MSRMIVWAVTDLPQPDSPTMASTSPFLQMKIDSPHGLDFPRISVERNFQVFYFKYSFAHRIPPSLTHFFGSRASRRPSPNKLKHNNMNENTNVGNRMR